MTFLNPTALFALIAASFPLVIHLLNLRKLKKVEISSLAFIKELQKTRIKRIKIRQWILLAVRTFLIASLALAFSKPAIRSFKGHSAGAKTTAVIIIDNSVSMSVVDAGGSYFNQAKQAAEKITDNLNTGDELSVMFTGDITSGEIKPSADFYRQRKKIEDAQIANYCSPLTELITKARKTLSESQNVNKEIYIISDFQKSTLFPAEDKGTPRNDLKNDYLRVYLAETPERKISNLSLTGLAAGSQIFEPGGTVSFTATVSNYSSSDVENSSASLFINGKRAAQQGVNIKSGETKLLTFETTLNQTGYLNISAGLEDDDIPLDNKRYMSLYVPEKIRVVSFSDNQEDLNYVYLAAEALSSGSLELTRKNAAQVSSIDLSKYDLLLLCGSESFSSYAPLQEYLTNGGGVIFFPGSKSSLVNYNKLCGALQAAPGEKLVSFQNASQAPVFNKIDFQHPVLSGIFEKGEEKNISSPSFYNYIKLAAVGGKELFTLTGGAPFLIEHSVKKGKLLQFSSAPVLNCSDFPEKALFAPLINKCISYLAVKFSDKEDKLAGDILLINADTEQKGVKAELPDGQTVMINSGGRGGAVVFTNTVQTGNYKFFSGGQLIDFSSLNLNPKESVLERMKQNSVEEQIKKETPNCAIYGLDIKKDFTNEIEASRFGLELWKYFLIFALLMGIVEMFLSKSARKDMITAEKG